ncbi:hypothetical protein [Micromonospora sp. CB01531]|nr:hypothetical protein [Micromonospora sp. CB01531]
MRETSELPEHVAPSPPPEMTAAAVDAVLADLATVADRLIADSTAAAA